MNYCKLNHNRKLLLLMSVILSVLFTQIAFAQSWGEVRGRVADVNDASVKGASVELTNQNTNEKKTAITDENGYFVFVTLSVGKYTVSVTQSGFTSTTQKDISVSIAATSTINLILKPTGVEATVTVSSGDTITEVNSSDQQLSTLIDEKRLSTLPTLGNDPNSLIGLAPGVATTTSALGGFTINGSRERNNNFTLGGVDNNDTEVPGGGGGVTTLSTFATAEFRVLTGSFSAESGRNSGGLVASTIKSGTNSFHGAAYAVYRSDKFAARNFFDVTGETTPLNRKQFGGAFGGPIVKNKAFFFFNYEGLRETIGLAQTRSVPSAAARLGILRVPGLVGTINLNDASSNAFALDTFDPAIRRILNLYPVGNPNDIDVRLPGTFDIFRFNYNQKNKENKIATRVNYAINSNHGIDVGYLYNKGLFDVGAETFPGLGDTTLSPQQGHLLTVGLTSSFTSSLTHEVKFGWNRVKADFLGVGDGGVSSRVPDAIDSAFTAAGYARARSFGGRNGTTINLVNTGINGFSGGDSQRRTTGTTSIIDNVTYVTGKHIFKFGGDFRWVGSKSDTNFGRGETLDFSPAPFGFDFIPTVGTGSPFYNQINSYASFYYGLAWQQSQSQFFDKAGVRTNDDTRTFRTKEWDLFLQDSWRIKQNLVLTIGVRYERQTVPYEANGLLSTLVNQDPSSALPTGGFVFQLVGKNSGSKINLYEDDKNNFSPRLGFNYSPNFENSVLKALFGSSGDSSIRGGYGIYYDRIFGNLFINARGNAPFQRDFAAQPVDLLSVIGRPATQTATAIATTDDQLFPVIFARPGNNKFQSKLATPYEQKWSFGIQRKVIKDLLLEVDYVGSKGSNLLAVIDGQLVSVERVNSIRGTSVPISSTSGFTNYTNGSLNSAFFNVALNTTTAFSTYNSLQTRVTKRYSGRFIGTGEIQGGYTWSHSIDNSADPLVAQSGERNFPRDSAGFAGGTRSERGNSGFDVRHRFVMSFTNELPIKFENKILDKIFGNFEIAGIFAVNSGRPYSIIGNSDSAGTGLSQRADFAVSGGTNFAVSTLVANPRVQTGLFRQNFTNPCPIDAVSVITGGTPRCAGARTNGRGGNTARNGFVGPGFNNFDFSVIKSVPISEKVKFKIRSDFFNLFNRVNFGQPVNALGSLDFGRSTGAASGRRIQFGGSLEF